MSTIYQNFVSGTLSVALATGGTTVSGSALSGLQVVAAPDTMWMVIDPQGLVGTPEVVQITTHTASATTATVVRAQQGTTSPASWPIGTQFEVGGPTLSDMNELPFRKLTAQGDLLVATAPNTTSRLAVGAANRVLRSNGTDPSWGQVQTADIATGAVTSNEILDGTIVNADISAAAAIAYAKLVLTNAVTNGDIAATAAIAYSKLALGNSIVNADVNTAAAIAYTKLALTNSIVNGDINSAAAIAYSKLNLAGSVVNADISAAAAIAYSKLVLTGQVVNADIAAGAAIAYSKLALTGSIQWADLAAAAKPTIFQATTPSATFQVLGQEWYDTTNLVNRQWNGTTWGWRGGRFGVSMDGATTADVCANSATTGLTFQNGITAFGGCTGGATGGFTIPETGLWTFTLKVAFSSDPTAGFGTFVNLVIGGVTYQMNPARPLANVGNNFLLTCTTYATASSTVVASVFNGTGASINAFKTMTCGIVQGL